MKNTITAIAVSVALSGAPALAGGTSTPVMEPEVIAAETTDASSREMQIILAYLTVTLILSAGLIPHL